MYYWGPTNKFVIISAPNVSSNSKAGTQHFPYNPLIPKVYVHHAMSLLCTPSISEIHTLIIQGTCMVITRGLTFYRSSCHSCTSVPELACLAQSLHLGDEEQDEGSTLKRNKKIQSSVIETLHAVVL